MNALRSFFRQKVPKCSGNMPLYLKHSVKFIDQMLAVFFSVTFLFLYVFSGRFFLLPIAFLLVMLIKIFNTDRIPARVNLLMQFLIITGWCVWYVVGFGWGLGGQNMLIVLIVLVFFCLFEPPLTKLAYFLAILVTRMLLFSYSNAHEPLFVLNAFSQFLVQTLNSSALFLILSGTCILYSSNLQETERLLLLHNQQLQIEAETDPLTGLINRRGLFDIMRQYVEANPEAMYCIAIADIDFFKKVNDTYGHNCGDYVLKQLARLFIDHSCEGFSASRWGGEEFCFFFPGVNIDEAGRIVTELLVAVRKMPLEYEGQRFSITLTAGVEENDFRSPLSELIESADRKLYRGKENGRNQIVF